MVQKCDGCTSGTRVSADFLTPQTSFVDPRPPDIVVLFCYLTSCVNKQASRKFAKQIHSLEIPLLQTGQRLGLKTEKAREAAEAIIRSEKRSRLLSSREEL